MRYISFVILTLIMFVSIESFGQRAMTRSLSQKKETKDTKEKKIFGAFGEVVKVQEPIIEEEEETSKELVRHFDLAEESLADVADVETAEKIATSKSIVNTNLMDIMVINERNPWNVSPPKSEAFLFHDAKIITNESGFYIQLIESDEILVKEHKIYQEFGNLRVKTTIDGKYCYLIGSFTTEKSGSQFLDNIILPRYPNAELVHLGEEKSK